MNITSLSVRALLLTVFFVGVAGVAAINRPVPTVAPVSVPVRTVSNVVELPTVSVRPTTAEIADAMREDSAFEVAHAMSASHVRGARAATSALPSLGLDMPYYSFGKAFPRVSKE
jgi:hypothetical protein